MSKSLADGLNDYYAALALADAPAPVSLIRSKKMRSRSLAVHPKQRAEAMEDAKKRGVPTHFGDDGRPEFDGMNHQRRYCREYGFFNRDDNASPQDHKGGMERAIESAKTLLGG